MEVAEDGSDARGRRGCCEPAVGRGRTAWEVVGRRWRSQRKALTLEEGGVAVNQLLVGAGQRRKRWGRCRMSQRKALTLE